MHFDPKIQNLLIIYCLLFFTDVIFTIYADFFGLRLRPGMYWATPWNLLGYALEFTGLCPGIYYYTGRQPHTGEYDDI